MVTCIGVALLTGSLATAGQDPDDEDVTEKLRVFVDDFEDLPMVKSLLRGTMRMVDSDKSPVLVIPTERMAADQMLSITEDLQIMSRVLEKRLQRADLLDRSLHRLPWHGTAVDAIYLEGYGVLFTMDADLPLAPTQAEPTAGEDDEVDRVWEQTKREMFASEGPWIKSLYDRYNAETYDPDRVSELEYTLIDALVHARNIRSLQPDDWIIIAVRGRQVWDRAVLLEKRFHKYDDDKNLNRLELRDVDGPRLTVMTLRVKRADVDALAEADIDEQVFRDRVSVITY